MGGDGGRGSGLGGDGGRRGWLGRDRRRRGWLFRDRRRRGWLFRDRRGWGGLRGGRGGFWDGRRGGGLGRGGFHDNEDVAFGTDPLDSLGLCVVKVDALVGLVVQLPVLDHARLFKPRRRRPRHLARHRIRIVHTALVIRSLHPTRGAAPRRRTTIVSQWEE